MSTATEERPLYTKVLEKGPPDHATLIFLISCDEGWRVSIVCQGMYEWAADWLVAQIQGKPYATVERTMAGERGAVAGK